MLDITNRSVIAFHKPKIKTSTLIFSCPMLIFAIDMNKTTSGTNYSASSDHFETLCHCTENRTHPLTRGAIPIASPLVCRSSDIVTGNKSRIWSRIGS